MVDAEDNGYPNEYEEWVVLRNGVKVFLRPIKPTDGHFLVDLFNKLSPHSRYLRFLSHLRSLPEEWIYRFTHVNYRSDFALVGFINEDERESIIAAARYHYNHLTERTDLAIAVWDDLQNFGLGSIMLLKLVGIAIEKGISRFDCTLDLHNTNSLKILNKLGLTMRTFRKGGLCYIELDA
jgi:GNAT superfamily N-acetyltransferase